MRSGHVILKGDTVYSGAGSRGHSMHLTDDQRRARRQETILTIWERWTDGNPVLRRAMEDPANTYQGRESLMAILRVMARLQGYGRTPSVRAAIAAGWAGVYLLRDAPEPTIHTAVRRAVRADRFLWREDSVQP